MNNKNLGDAKEKNLDTNGSDSEIDLKPRVLKASLDKDSDKKNTVKK